MQSQTAVDPTAPTERPPPLDAAIARALAARTVTRCNCCGARYSAASWLALKYIGLQDLYDGKGGVAECRDCTCGSTISAVVEPVVKVRP